MKSFLFLVLTGLTLQIANAQAPALPPIPADPVPKKALGIDDPVGGRPMAIPVPPVPPKSALPPPVRFKVTKPVTLDAEVELVKDSTVDTFVVPFRVEKDAKGNPVLMTFTYEAKNARIDGIKLANSKYDSGKQVPAMKVGIGTKLPEGSTVTGDFWAYKDDWKVRVAAPQPNVIGGQPVEPGGTLGTDALTTEAAMTQKKLMAIQKDIATLKADAAVMKADIAGLKTSVKKIETLVGKAASAESVGEALMKKADAEAVQKALDKKADAETVIKDLTLKADKSDTPTKGDLDKKADKTDVEKLKEERKTLWFSSAPAVGQTGIYEDANKIQYTYVVIGQPVYVTGSYRVDCLMGKVQKP